MTQPDTQQTVASLTAHLRRTESIMAITGVAVAVIAFALLVVLAAVLQHGMDAEGLLIAVGLGSISASVVGTVRSFVFVVPLDGAASDGMISRRVRRAIFSDDDTGLREEELDRASRWAAVMALNIRSNLVSSALFVVGLGTSAWVSLASGGGMMPLAWILPAVLLTILTLDAFMLRRLVRCRRFALRTGAAER